MIEIVGVILSDAAREITEVEALVPKAAVKRSLQVQHQVPLSVFRSIEGADTERSDRSETSEQNRDQDQGPD